MIWHCVTWDVIVPLNGSIIFHIHINDLQTTHSNSLMTSQWLKWLTVSQAVKWRLRSTPLLNNQPRITWTQILRKLMKCFAQPSRSVTPQSVITVPLSNELQPSSCSDRTIKWLIDWLIEMKTIARTATQEKHLHIELTIVRTSWNLWNALWWRQITYGAIIIRWWCLRLNTPALWGNLRQLLMSMAHLKRLKTIISEIITMNSSVCCTSWNK